MYYLSVISICLNLTTSFNYHKCVSMVSFGVSEDLGLWHLFNIKEVGISLLEIVSFVLNYGYFVSGRLSQKKYETALSKSLCSNINGAWREFTCCNRKKNMVSGYFYSQINQFVRGIGYHNIPPSENWTRRELKFLTFHPYNISLNYTVYHTVSKKVWPTLLLPRCDHPQTKLGRTVLFANSNK